MIRVAPVFLILSLISAVIGFGGIGIHTPLDVAARVSTLLFVTLFCVIVVAGLARYSRMER